MNPAAPIDGAVIPTGAANLASMLAGLRRAGVLPAVTLDAERIAASPLVVLPGVGSFGHARAALDAAGLGPVVQARIAAGRPLLAICVGMQLLFDASEESPGVAGLGVLPGTVRRFASSPSVPAAPAESAVRVPQMGWNRVEVGGSRPPDDRDRVDPLAAAGDGAAYFANSYRVAAADLVRARGTVATAEHGGERFVAAIARDGLLACQCHPELSGAWGRRLLAAWVAAAAACGVTGNGGARSC